MDRETVNSLIEHIWTVETQLKAALRTLDTIETALADETED